MTRQLIMLAALPKDQVWFPAPMSTSYNCLITPATDDPKLASGLWHLPITDTQTSKITFFKKKKKRKLRRQTLLVHCCL